MANRLDLATDKLNFINSQTSALGTKNGILPTLVAIATASNQGLAGTQQLVPLRGRGTLPPGAALPAGIQPCPPSIGSGFCEAPPTSILGGVGTALGQMIRRDYPTEGATVFFAPTLRNQTAQADYAIEQFGLRQTALQNQRTINQVSVDVSNQSIGLQQARSKYLAASRNRVLQEQLLQAEQRKFSLGASTSFLVVQQQRDLATAQSTEVAALVTYSNARVALDQTLGLTLKNNHISLQEAQNGAVDKPSALPATLPAQP
jgi:outer membrane protein